MNNNVLNAATGVQAGASAGDRAEVAVACRGVVKDFGKGEAKVRALRGIDVEVYSGQMTLLVGPSGCGKTTLISILAGLLHPTEGDVRLFGTLQSQLKGRDLVQFRAQHVGFVFQQFNLLPALTALENVAVPLLIQGVRRCSALDAAGVMLEQVDLSNRAEHLPSELSGGQQQRVAIARALVHEPRLMVCDEPTAALDARSGQAVMGLVKRLVVRPGRAVIVVTHDHRVFNFGDRIIEMVDGLVANVSNQTAGYHEQSTPADESPQEESLARPGGEERATERGGP